MMYDACNNTPGRVGPPLAPPTDDLRQYFHDWLDGDGYPFWPFFSNVQSWWNIRDLPNVMMVHFNNLKADLEGEIRRIADFLDIEPSADAWPKIVEHSTFAHMKANADAMTPMADKAFKDGADTTLVGYLANSGATSGTWTSPFTDPLFPGFNEPRDVSHISYYGRGTPTEIPEPSLLMLLMLGLGSVALGRLRAR
jgi:aryl sulfotransferase